MVFKSQLFHLPGARSCASYSTLLGLSFFFCKVKNIMVQQMTPDLLIIYQEITSPLFKIALFYSQFCGLGFLMGGFLLELHLNINGVAAI